MSELRPQTPLTGAFLDRIVDGELSPAELRAALDRLEREPDGWKRCALAFLEAQCWRAALREVEVPSPGLAAIARPSGEQVRHRRRPAAKWRALAQAATIAALAFGLGWRLRPERPVMAPVQDVGQGVQVVQHPSPPETSATVVRPDPADAPELAGPIDLPASSSVVTVGRLRIGPTEDSATVPILAGPAIDEKWLRDRPSPLTDHEQALLEQQGYHVDRRRRLLRARLADGKQLAVPVDQIQVSYTGIESL